MSDDEYASALVTNFVVYLQKPREEIIQIQLI